MQKSSLFLHVQYVLSRQIKFLKNVERDTKNYETLTDIYCSPTGSLHR